MKNHIIASVNSRKRTQALPASTVALAMSGVTQKEWHANPPNWAPLTVTATVPAAPVTPTVLLTLGGWWDSARDTNTSNRPNDSIGGLLPVIYNQSLPSGQDPVKIQVCMKDAPAGNHVITPPSIGSSGDGWLLVTRATGVQLGVAPRDKGRIRLYHTFVGIPDSNSYQSVTIETDGTLAQVGDLVVAMFIMDNEQSPNINAQIPAGWTLLGKNSVVIENIGYAACYKTVTAAGKQSATFTWTDNSTNVVEAAIVVLAKA